MIDDSIGKAAKVITQNLEWSKAEPIWGDFSTKFCQQASGTVNAFISNSAYRGVDSVFWKCEMLALMSNPKVNEVIIHIFE